MEEVDTQHQTETLKHDIFVAKATAVAQSNLISKLRMIVHQNAVCTFNGAHTYRVNVDKGRYFTVTPISGLSYTIIIKEYNKQEEKFTLAGEDVDSLYQMISKRVMESKANAATKRLEDISAIVDGWLD